MSEMDLTDKQQHVISLLPASKHDIADDLGVSPNTVKSHIEALRKKEVPVEFDRGAGQYYLLGDEGRKIRRISTKHKGTKTRQANEWTTEMEKTILRRLNAKEPLTAPPTSDPDSESFCAAIGDTHFGDKVETEDGRVVYDMETAHESVVEFTEDSLKVKQMMESMVDFDDAYLFLLGDISTGEAIYDGQVWDIESHLLDQVSSSVDSFLYLIESYAENFDTVQVGGVLGNHGRDRASASSQQANTDLLTYRWLEDRVIDRGWDNVRFEVGEAKHFKNLSVRDWNFHIRHGDDTLKHVDDTAASSRDWRGWQNAHNFDVALRGHHHKPSFNTVLNNYPVFTVPSPKNGSEFADRIGQPDVSNHKDLGWVFGTSDKRPVTFSYLIDDK